MKKLLAIILCTILCGCVNLTIHLDNQVTTVYEPTCVVWEDCVCVFWSENARNHPVVSSIIKATYPYWLVDIILEATFDTLTFPYDLWKKNSYIRSRDYEEDLFYKVSPEDFEKCQSTTY